LGHVQLFLGIASNGGLAFYRHTKSAISFAVILGITPDLKTARSFLIEFQSVRAILTA
jgi:hypothetical protein